MIFFFLIASIPFINQKYLRVVYRLLFENVNSLYVNIKRLLRWHCNTQHRKIRFSLRFIKINKQTIISMVYCKNIYFKYQETYFYHPN